MNRRHFTSTLALGACAGWKSLAAPEKITAPPRTPPWVGSQLYGWGQYYQREGKDLNAHLDEVFSALRDAGYDYAEGNLDTVTPANNAKLAEQMKAKGLKPLSLYTGGAFHVLGKASETAERIAVAAKVAAKAGFGIINVNADPIGRLKTEKELAIQAEALTELGTALKEIGMNLGIHHHTPELANQGQEFHSNFRQCPKSLVGFCYDVHWVYRGGIAPQECLALYGDRIVSWHLRQSRKQIWWEDLDSGDIDYAAVAAYAKSHQVPAFYSVELALESGTAITRSVVENHARSRKFIRQVFGV